MVSFGEGWIFEGAGTGYWERWEGRGKREREREGREKGERGENEGGE